MREALPLKLLLYGLSILSLSQSANLVRWAAAPPDVVGFWRLLGAALLLLPWAFASGKLQKLKTAPRQQLSWILISALFFFAHLWTYFYAAQNTRIAHCMILFATNPLWTAAGNRLFFGSRFPPRLLISYAFALAGVFVLVRHSLGFEQGLLFGDISALLSAFFFAGYLLTGRQVRKHTDNLSYTSIMYLVTGVLFGVSGVLQGVNFHQEGWNTWMGILGTILLPTLLGHALFTWLMKDMDLNRMTAGKLLEPIIAALTASFLFGEGITPPVVMAFVLTGLGVLLSLWPEKTGPLRC